MHSSASTSTAAKERARVEKKGHVCPPSNATHPSQRWETAFVYAFIVKFTNLKVKTEGFETATDLEEAILSPTQHPLLAQILSRFVLNLRPQTRNLSPDQLSTTLSSVLQDYMKPPERTVFWDDELQANVDPLQGIRGGIWGATWDLKLRILRQLVELQLSHNSDIKEIIDRAWGVVHNKHRKRDTLPAPLDPSDPQSVERLSTVPLGQDLTRKRYWALDDSPRLYTSTNPWKVTAEFKAVADTKDDYLKIVEELKAKVPEKAKSLSKMEQTHSNLVTLLQNRVLTIDSEQARIQKVRRKIEQKEILKAQAELRSTRTRRQVRKPDYVYHQEIDSDDDGDEYTYQEDNEDDDHVEPDEDEFMDSYGYRAGQRRSQRTSTRNSNGKRNPDVSTDWRVERRSSRLGANIDATEDGHWTKRARTEERSVSSAPSDSLASPVVSVNESQPPKKSGAAAVRPNEVAVEQIAGKKKSKFWFYAVEPSALDKLSGNHSREINPNNSSGYQNGIDHATSMNKDFTVENSQNGIHEKFHSTLSAEMN